MKNSGALAVVLSLFLQGSSAFATPKKDPCITVARKAAAKHVRAQDYFKDFDPKHEHKVVIRSISVNAETKGELYTVNVEYGLPGEENTDVAEDAACEVETVLKGKTCEVSGPVSCDAS